MTVCHVLFISMPVSEDAITIWIMYFTDQALITSFVQGRRPPYTLLLPILALLSCCEVASKKVSTASGSRSKLQQRLLQRDPSEGLWGDASAYPEENEDWGGRGESAARSSKGALGQKARDRDLELVTTSAASHQGIFCACNV